MLNIIGIGPSKGNITLDALKALDDSDIILEDILFQRLIK